MHGRLESNYRIWRLAKMNLVIRGSDTDSGHLAQSRY